MMVDAYLITNQHVTRTVCSHGGGGIVAFEWSCEQLTEASLLFIRHYQHSFATELRQRKCNYERLIQKIRLYIIYVSICEAD